MTAIAAYNVRWTETAEEDLTAIVDYIASDDPETALVMYERIWQKATELDALPMRGRIVPELSHYGVRNYREVLPLPWRIIYRIEGKTVYVTAVLDGRRDLEDLLLDRLGRR